MPIANIKTNQFIFLLFTLLNLEVLGIQLFHPRVVVELLVFLGLALLGCYWIR